MHKYMRAVGFSKYSRAEIKNLISDTVRRADHISHTKSADGAILTEFRREYAEDLGICVAGVSDEDGRFHTDYYFPYLRGTGITSYEDITVERHAARESYAGICDDLRVGISMIFYLQNKIPYVHAQVAGHLPIRGTTLTMAALSQQGTVLLPVIKDPDDITKTAQESAKHVKLLTEARNGNEEAIEMLTMQEMDLYSQVSMRIKNEDLYSIVDTSVMPYGVECDHYTIIGEIVGIRLVENHITEEKIYILNVSCHELTYDVAINSMDLFGEPRIGRRFKGVIWLQGEIHFPEEL